MVKKCNKNVAVAAAFVIVSAVILGITYVVKTVFNEEDLEEV